MIAQVFKEFNPKNKTKAWFTRLLDELMVKKSWLIEKPQWEINRSFAEGRYDTAFAKRKFDNFNEKVDQLNVDFTPLDLFGVRRSAITSILEKQGYEIRAVCTDPSASSKREKDIELLKAEKALEPIRQQLGQAVGMNAPLPIAKDTDFSSDVSPVKSMGLDISNPVDEAIFSEYLQRQKWEIAIELAVTHYLNLSGFKETFKSWVESLVDNNCYAGQVVTNSFSGEPELIELHPFETYTVLGRRPDRKDALGKGWEKLVTVREIIALMGKEIDATQLNDVLSAANFASATDWVGVWTDPLAPCPAKHCMWNAFLNMKCSLGYLEIKSQDSDLYESKLDNGSVITTKHSPDYMLPDGLIAVGTEKDLVTPRDRTLEYRFYDVTYKAFYLPYTRKVFGFGKLPLQSRFGTKNQLTDFSIITYIIGGKSMNEKCQPFIKHIFSLWCTYQHFINESRPSGESWNIDVVREIADELVIQTGETGKIIGALKVLQNMTNTVHKLNTIDGKVVGGDGDPVKPRVRGIDPTVEQIIRLMTFDLQQITEITGVSSILLAQQSPDQKDGLGVSRLYLQQSLNTIYYITYGIECGFSNASFDLCQKVQWIANGDVGVEAFKSLSQAIGDRNVGAIKELGTQPPYSFSIFFEFGINPLEQQRLEAMTDLMIQNKTLSPAQTMSVSEIKNYKLAAALLGYYEVKAQQQAQEGMQSQLDGEMQKEQQRHQNQMEEDAQTIAGDKEVANIQGEWIFKTKELEMGKLHDLQETKDFNAVAHGDIKHQQELQKMDFEQQQQNAPDAGAASANGTA